MSSILRFVLALLVTLSFWGVVQAQEQRFTHAGVQGDAKRYEAYLKGNWQPKGNARELRAEGERVLAAGNDPRAAARAYAQAVVFDANDVQSWTGLARALLAIKPDQGSRALRSAGQRLGRGPRSPTSAAQTPAAKAAALWVLHEALQAPLLLASRPSTP